MQNCFKLETQPHPSRMVIDARFSKVKFQIARVNAPGSVIPLGLLYVFDKMLVLINSLLRNSKLKYRFDVV
jgi:hypothetical protein